MTYGPRLVLRLASLTNALCLTGKFGTTELVALPHGKLVSSARGTSKPITPCAMLRLRIHGSFLRDCLELASSRACRHHRCGGSRLTQHLNPHYSLHPSQHHFVLDTPFSDVRSQSVPSVNLLSSNIGHFVSKSSTPSHNRLVLLITTGTLCACPIKPCGLQGSVSPIIPLIPHLFLPKRHTHQAATMSTPGTSRKRCELACTLCRRRKIKCLRTVQDRKACDKCAEKGTECVYIPVADDVPPPKPRQTPPSSSGYTNTPMAHITPPRDYTTPPHAPSSSPPPDYYSGYQQYPSTSLGSLTNYPHLQSVSAPLQLNTHYEYGAPASPTHHIPSSPTSMGYCDDSGASGLAAIEGGVDSLSMLHWSGQSQHQYAASLPVQVAQNPLWASNVPGHTEMPPTYYEPNYSQPPVQQYAQSHQHHHQAYASSQYQSNSGSYYGSS